MAVYRPTLGGQILKFDMSTADYIEQERPIMQVSGQVSFNPGFPSP
ncbi:MAG: hypothetical protein AB7E85_07250 [Pseudobdellovibrionaceae bacterium]